MKLLRVLKNAASQSNPRKHHGSVQLRTKIAQFHEVETEVTRLAAVELVEDRKRSGAPKMLAYSSVASAIGSSSSWLRKFIGRSPDAKEPRWSVGIAIVKEYNNLCECIEADASVRKMRAEIMRGDLNALVVRNRGLVPGVHQRVAGTKAAAPVRKEPAPQDES